MANKIKTKDLKNGRVNPILRLLYYTLLLWFEIKCVFQTALLYFSLVQIIQILQSTTEDSK